MLLKKLAPILVAAAALCGIVAVTLLPAQPAHAAQALGTPENPFFASAHVRDASGIALTVTTAASTLPVLKSATLLVEDRNTGITFSATNGTWTIPAGGGGAYEIHATIGNCINSVDAHTNLFSIYKNTTQVGNITKRIEPSTKAQNLCGTMIYADDLVVGDVITIKADAADNGDVITVRDAAITIRRVAPAE